MRTQKSCITKELLLEEFVANKKTTVEIGKEYGVDCSLVKYYLKKYGLYKKQKSVRSRTLPSKDVLYQKYVIENKTLSEVADELNYKSYNNISYALRKYNIPIRSRTLSTKYCGKVPLYYFSILKRSIPHRHRTDVLDFDISIEYISELFDKQHGRCRYSNVELIFSNTTTDWCKTTTASLDRINSSIGYVEDNVQWVHKNINYMKHELSHEEFIEWCNMVINHRDNK